MDFHMKRETLLLGIYRCKFLYRFLFQVPVLISLLITLLYHTFSCLQYTVYMSREQTAVYIDINYFEISSASWLQRAENKSVRSRIKSPKFKILNSQHVE